MDVRPKVYDTATGNDYNNNVGGTGRVKECLCKRPRSVVKCSSCGIWFQGRVSRWCEAHPRVIHLMDYTYCPGCKRPSTVLKEIN